MSSNSSIAWWCSHQLFRRGVWYALLNCSMIVCLLLLLSSLKKDPLSARSLRGCSLLTDCSHQNKFQLIGQQTLIGDLNILVRRPIMHTFYEESDAGEKDLLELWKQAWDEAGWDTVVLDLEDAQKHPYYGEMFSVIDPLWGMTYNGLCYYRWLAMAASGGGWMSDYDLFPTNFPKEEGFMENLPNGGNFSSFEAHVPSLMSGSDDEWLRVTKLLIDALKEDRVESPFKSDMLTFKQLKVEGIHDVQFDVPEYNLMKGYMYKKRGEVDCKNVDASHAIHFSHYQTLLAYETSTLPYNLREGENLFSNREPAIKRFLEDWGEQCIGPTYTRSYY